MGVQDEFLKDLKTDGQKDELFDEPLNIEGSGADSPDGFEAKNRRERRLLRKNQQLREEAIAATARAEAIAESSQFRAGTEETEYLKRVERIYGNDTPEKAEATNLLKEALEGVKQAAKDEALQEFQKERGSESLAVRQEEQNLDNMMEEIEDDYNADFSDPNTRQGFLTLLEKVSPKDRDGNIIEFADPATTWELFESRRDRASSRAKELSSRSMTRSGQSQPSRLQDDATERFLRENGII